MKAKGTVKERRVAARGRKLEKTRKWARGRAAEHPEEVVARAAVRGALKRGDLVRGTECCSCGEIKPTVAHHWSYEKEHWLDVVWICRSCHAKHT